MTNPVNEKPIIFSADMVRAILAGKKTQTRRPGTWKLRSCEEGLNLKFSGLQLGHYCTDQPESGWVLRSRGRGGCWNDRTYPYKSKYGRPGDRLWVRETWGEFDPDHWHEPGMPRDALISDAVRVDGVWHPVRNGVYYAADTPPGSDGDRCRLDYGYKYRSPIHMFRWASRINLLIKDIRLERLQEISEEDAAAEGFAPVVVRERHVLHDPGPSGGNAPAQVIQREKQSCVAAFRAKWKQLYAKRPEFVSRADVFVEAVTFDVES